MSDHQIVPCVWLDDQAGVAVRPTMRLAGEPGGRHVACPDAW